MILARRVDHQTWLTLYQSPAPLRSHGAERRAADCVAAGRAWSLAAAAAGISPESAAGSRAHTEGSGAALVGPAGRLMGIDLVPLGRITPRHARAILDSEEWDAVARVHRVGPALAWGLKEAAAKAFGDPGRRFPGGLRIAGRTDEFRVIDLEDPHESVAGHWQLIGSLICVWVLGGS